MNRLCFVTGALLLGLGAGVAPSLSSEALAAVSPSFAAAVGVDDAPAPMVVLAAAPGDRRLTGRARAAAARGTPKTRVEAANRAAAREPTRQNYVNAAQLYAWTEGAVYRLYTAPERVSEIALQPGEGLISVAAGDTLRWVIGDTTSGSGAARRTHILVKPSTVGLRTNLVITTDRRVYHVQLESTARTAMASMSWTYREDELLALRVGEAGSSAAAPVAAALSLETLNFGYRIEGDRPTWRPVRAFDDGRQVFVEFPPGLLQDEAPPLFVVAESGRAELVNFRVRGRYYIVDRLFTAAELRLGEKRQRVVRIIRSDPDPRRRRRGRAS
jgi:type IV secretion system protein VirB9